MDDEVAPDPYGLISGLLDNHAGTGGYPIVGSRDEFLPFAIKKDSFKNSRTIETDAPQDTGAQNIYFNQ